MADTRPTPSTAASVSSSTAQASSPAPDAPGAPPPIALSALRIDRSASAPRRRRRWPMWLAAAVVIVVALAALMSRRAPVEVDIGTVALAYPTQGLTILNATGRVVAQRRAAVSSKATGRLEWLGVQEGQRVRAGEIVARIENRDVGAAREQAEANVNQAKANLEQGIAERDNALIDLKRQQDLLKQGFVSPSVVDSAQARYARAQAVIASQHAAIGVAQANLKAAEVNFEQTLIRAPFDGIVLTKNANVGDIITPFSSATGTTGAVVNIADMSTLEVEADVSESSIAKITVDQPAEIQLDAFTELRLAGKVSRVVPTVDRSKATLLVKVSFIERDARVLPDMSAKIAFLSRAPRADERTPVVAVRASAIVKRDGKDVVFVVLKDESSGAEKTSIRPVAAGARLGDLVQVSGIAAGDRIVLAPTDKLVDGTLVAAAKK